MRTATVVIAAALMIAFVAPAAAAASVDAEEPVEGSLARRCIIGSDGNCLIPVYCVTEPCWSFP